MHYGALIAIAGKQYGCFTRAQALSVMSGRQLEWLVSTGGAFRCHTNTYVLTGFANTWHQRATAAVLSIKSAVASHESAAQLWGLTKFNAPQISLTVPKTWSGKRDGIVIHRSSHIDVSKLQLIPVSSAVRTLVDLAGRTHVDLLGQYLDRALSGRLITLAAITKYLGEDESGRAGLKQLRTLCTLRNPADEKLESELERRTLKWLRQAGLPDPDGQHPIPAEFTTYHADHAYPAIKLAIESDGPVHLQPSVARFDRLRDMDLRSMGWEVIRITATMTPRDVLPYIVKALKTQAA